VAKNAGNTVQALLARAPAPPRASAQLSSSPAPPDPVCQGDHADQAHAGPQPAAPAVPVIDTPDPLQRRSRPPLEPSAPGEPTVPPTLRLSQPIAQALRSAWLTAKRDRVLLTYQDFAGEIIALGLRGGDGGSATAAPSPVGEGSPVPRTLRLALPTAEALRSAWLTAKRDRVLLTYQDFAGEIIALGLWQQHLGDNRNPVAIRDQPRYV
jgi:hypothetical protein